MAFNNLDQGTATRLGGAVFWARYMWAVYCNMITEGKMMKIVQVPGRPEVHSSVELSFMTRDELCALVRANKSWWHERWSAEPMRISAAVLRKRLARLFDGDPSDWKPKKKSGAKRINSAPKKSEQQQAVDAVMELLNKLWEQQNETLRLVGECVQRLEELLDDGQ